MTRPLKTENCLPCSRDFVFKVILSYNKNFPKFIYYEKATQLEKMSLFFTLLSNVKTNWEIFFKSLWPSQYIWTLMSAYPLNFAAFECHTCWYILCIIDLFFLFYFLGYWYCKRNRKSSRTVIFANKIQKKGNQT